MSESKYSPALHAAALLTACLTFPLIFMGGLVTSHGAGMSVPDWPNSYGYNMFLFPPRLWIGGIRYEHLHRLMGTLVGMSAIALVCTAWKVEHRRWVRWLAVAVLAAIIAQGALGGLRVVLVRLGLAVIHGIFAQAVFCLTALMAVVTSRWWSKTPEHSVAADGGRTIIRLAVLAVVMIYLQLIAGAVMRHYRAGLAIPDLPLAYGKLLPPTHQAELDAVNRFRASQPVPQSNGSDMDLAVAEQLTGPVSMAQVWVHFAHRVGALLVTIAVVSLAVYVLVGHRRSGLTGPAVLVLFLLTAQLTLGVLTVVLHKTADIASLHVAVGALTLVTTFVLMVRSIRVYWPRQAFDRGAAEVRSHRAPDPALRNRPAIV